MQCTIIYSAEIIDNKGVTKGNSFRICIYVVLTLFSLVSRLNAFQIVWFYKDTEILLKYFQTLLILIFSYCFQ